jgi:lipopolysaccharide/colanic/teichoic acid biosynthesis glycosyltransferase
VSEAAAVPAQVIRGRNERLAYHAAKRLLDVVLAAALLVLLLPLLLLVAVLIKLESPGPVFFAQQRVGSRRLAGGTWELRTFRFYKFRSMVRDAGTALHEAHVKAFVEGRLREAGGPAQFKLQHDPRVTRVGAVLRRTSIDELPQLVNVLVGDMSLVGPRPLPVYEVSHYDAAHWQRFAALPGITGLWQVSGRCDVSFAEMARLDLDYVRRKSLRLDLKILLMTIPAVLSGRGAA